MGGGMDSMNLISPRDTNSQTIIAAKRQSAPSNILDYTDAIVKTGDIVTGSAVINNIDVTNLTTGLLVYGVGIRARRKLTIVSIGTGTITISDIAYKTLTGTSLSFGTATQMFKLNDSQASSVARNPAIHYTQTFLNDAFNTPIQVGNELKTKAAFVTNVGVLRKPLQLDSGGNLQLRGTNTYVTGIDVPPLLESHNDQAAIVQSNQPDGASVKGWGGGILDVLSGTISPSNKPLASISSGISIFSAGETTPIFSVSTSGLIRNIPDFYGRYTNVQDAPTALALKNAFIASTKTYDLVGSELQDSASNANELTNAYQSVLINTMNVPDIPQLNPVNANFNINTYGIF